MTIDTRSYATFLEKVAEDIDIPPGKYKEAVDRYEAVGHWLEGGRYSRSARVPVIYPQGSFRLGTVVRPVRGGVEVGLSLLRFPVFRQHSGGADELQRIAVIPYGFLEFAAH